MAATSSCRPSWQSDACPAWCVVEHQEDDPVPDRVHDSAGQYVPVVLAEPHGGARAPTELLVMLSRRCGESHEWVFVGEPERDGQRIVLSRESAVRLAGVMGSLWD